MKVTILRTPGVPLLKKLGADDRRDELVEGAVVDVSSNLANALFDRKLAEAGDVVQGTPPPAALQGVPSQPAPPAKSEVADLNAPEATEKIAGMRSKEKLQAIVDSDPRSSVQEAAKKRITELG